VIANIRDVTDQRRRREELVQAKEAAEEAARLKTAMLANMSHEVRTPLTSIIGFAEILADAGLEQPHAGFARQIYESGQRLQETLDTMLDLSRLEAGAVSPRPAAVDVAGLVTEVVREWEEQALRHDVDLTMDREEDLPPLSAGEKALRRVVTNLLANAIKFAPAGGSVRVCLRRERPPSGGVPRSTETDGPDGEAGSSDPGTRAPDPRDRAERVVVEVEDTGIGMEPSFAEEKAFEAFQQESVGTDREYEGTGLGLTIVDRYADLLGATVSISTRKGEGTTVTVSIPLDPAGSAPTT
jgi:signal transduction histidine kinase